MEGRNGPAAGPNDRKGDHSTCGTSDGSAPPAGRFVPVPWPQRPRRRRDRDGGYIRNRACSRRRGGGLLCRLGGVPGPYSGQDPGGAPDPDQLRLRPDRPGDIDPRPGGPGPRQKEPRRPAGAPAGAPPPEAHHLRGRVVGLSVFLRRRVHGCQTGEVRRQLRGLHRGATVWTGWTWTGSIRCPAERRETSTGRRTDRISTKLLRELRVRLDRQGRRDGKDYSLTIAGRAGSWYLDQIEAAKVADIVDHIFLMGYDFHGPGSGMRTSTRPCTPPPAHLPREGPVSPPLWRHI